MTVIPIVIGILGTIPRSLVKGLENLESREQGGDHLDNRIIKISQNIEKCNRDLKRLAVTQTLVKDHHLKLVWKTLKKEQQ